MIDHLQIGVAPGDEGLRNAQHVDGRLVQLHEHAVIDLSQAQQLQDLIRVTIKALVSLNSVNFETQTRGARKLTLRGFGDRPLIPRMRTTKASFGCAST